MKTVEQETGFRLTQMVCETFSSNTVTILNWVAIKVDITWRLSVDPVPTDRVVDWTSVSVNPDVSVLYQVVRVTNYELLKHVINVLICDDRQRWISTLTKLSRFIPSQWWIIGVETIVLTVHLVTLGHLDCIYEAGRYTAYTCDNIQLQEAELYCRYNACRHPWTIIAINSTEYIFVADNVSQAVVNLTPWALKSVILCEITRNNRHWPFKVTQGHRFWYRSRPKVRMRLPITVLYYNLSPTSYTVSEL